MPEPAGGASGIDPARLVFVAGLHRSGTSALAGALAEHPDVSGLHGTGVPEDEGQHLQDVYPAAARYGGSGYFAWEPAAHLTEQSPLVQPDAGERILQRWAPHWDLSRRLLVEKSPPNLVMGRFLQAIFPGSAMVVVIRHPVTVALGTRKWARWSRLSTLLEHNLRAYDLFLDDLPHLHRVHVVRYEDLVDDPGTVLDGIRDFLALDGPIPGGSIRAGHSTPYEDAWRTGATGWTGLEQRRLRWRTRARLAIWGYDADDLSRRRPWPGVQAMPLPPGRRRGTRLAARLSGRVRGAIKQRHLAQQAGGRSAKALRRS